MGKPYSLDLRQRICVYVRPETLVALRGGFMASVQRRRCVMRRINVSGARSHPSHRAGQRAGLASWHRMRVS